MKKFFALALLLSFGVMVGCGDEKKTTTSTAKTTVSTPKETTTSMKTTDDKPKGSM